MLCGVRGLNMNTKNEPQPAERADKPAEAEDPKQGVVRFAQYTAPIMLAMLVSAGKDAALALSA